MFETYISQSLDDLALLHLVLRKFFGIATELCLFGTDFRGWYRQHAILPSQQKFSVICYFNPYTQKVELAILFCAPFRQQCGASPSVQSASFVAFPRKSFAGHFRH